jgi:hypothetical protein
MAKICLEWIKTICKGNIAYIIKDTNIIIDPNNIILHGESIFLDVSSDMYKKMMENIDLVPEDSIKVTKVSFNNTIIDIPLITVIKINMITLPELIQVPDNLDRNVITFLLDKIVDYNNYDKYIMDMEFILTVKTIYKTVDTGTEVPKVEGLRTELNKPEVPKAEVPKAEVPKVEVPKAEIVNEVPKIKELEYTKFGYGNNNYNYNLGFNINLGVISKIFEKYDDFIVEYNKDVAKYVKISYPMEIPDHLISSITKKKKMFSHKFIIYKTGSINQSGPHPELNEIAYNRLFNIISYHHKELCIIKNDKNTK